MTRTALIIFTAAGLALAQTEHSDAYGQPIGGAPAAPAASPDEAPRAPQPPARPAYGLPAQVTAKTGTTVTVRINETLSSNHNKVRRYFHCNFGPAFGGGRNRGRAARPDRNRAGGGGPEG